MIKVLKSSQRILCQAIPALIAILIVEVVNIEVYLFGPVSKGELMLFIWIALQLIPGFFFGYISDSNFRKTTLIISQLLGIVGGLILCVFGFEIWVIVLIALTFNPLPVTRAVLLDHFPQYSTVKIVAITFLAQYFPWAFYHKFAQIDYKIVVFLILALLAINTLLTIFFFNGDCKSKEIAPSNLQKIHIIKDNSRLFRTLAAFIFAEAAFYLLWAYFEFNTEGSKWLSATNIATLTGITIAMLYTRLPHISIITLFYSIGAASTILALVHCTYFPFNCDINLLITMTDYCIIGGLYLPFVTDAVIKQLGSKHRALGSATIEFGDTIAAFFAPIINIFVKQNSFNILVIISSFFVLATIFQKSAEKNTKNKVKEILL